MSNKTVKKTPKNKKQIENSQPQLKAGQPWIAMKSGLVIIAITSVAMAVLTIWQVAPSTGIWEAILWGLLFGGLIWAIFLGFFLIRKVLGPKS